MFLSMMNTGYVELGTVLSLNCSYLIVINHANIMVHGITSIL